MQQNNSERNLDNIALELKRQREKVIQKLLLYIRNHGDKLISTGKFVILNPLCISIVNRFLNAKTNDPNFIRDQKIIRDFCNKVERLIIEPENKNAIGEVNNINLSIFTNLKFLELDTIKIATLSGFEKLALQMKGLSITGSLNSIEEIFTTQWPALVYLNCTKNDISFVHSKIAEFMPNLRSLNLTNNQISSMKKVELRDCIYLDQLDLTNNYISKFSIFQGFIGNIKVLSLRKNMIKNLYHIGRIYSLESLDLGENKIESFKQVKYLSLLPLLHTLLLDGNPISQMENYRIITLSYFSERLEEITLDHHRDTNLDDIKDYFIHKPKKSKKNIRRVVEILDNPNASIKIDNSDLIDIYDQKYIDDLISMRNEYKNKWLMYYTGKEFPSVSTPKRVNNPIHDNKKNDQQSSSNNNNLIIQNNKENNTTISNSKQRFSELPNTNDDHHNLQQHQKKYARHSMMLNADHHHHHHHQQPEFKNTYFSNDDLTIHKKRKEKTKKKRLMFGRTRSTFFLGVEAPSLSINSRDNDEDEDEDEDDDEDEDEEEKIVITKKNNVSLIDRNLHHNLSNHQIIDQQNSKCNNVGGGDNDDDDGGHNTINDHRIASNDVEVRDNNNDDNDDDVKENEKLENKVISDICVEKKENNEYVDRILQISTHFVNEFEPSSEIPLLTIAIKQITVISTFKHLSPTGRVILRIEFLNERKENSLVEYYFENHHSTDQFIQPIIQLNSLITHLLISLQLQCNNCNLIFDGIKEKNTKCPRCRSFNIIEYHSPNSPNFMIISSPPKQTIIPINPPPSSSPSSSSSSSSSSPLNNLKSSSNVNIKMLSTSPLQPQLIESTTSHYKQLFSDLDHCVNGKIEYDITFHSIDKQLESKFRRIFVDEVEENFQHLFRCSYLPIPPSSSSFPESTCYLLLTTQNIYIYTNDVSTDSFTFMESTSLHEITEVVCGLSLQYFAIKIADNISHLFLSRDHKRTHQFLDTLQEMIARIKINDRPPFSNTNLQILSSFSSILGISQFQFTFENYIHLYMKVKSSSYSGHYFFPHFVQSQKNLHLKPVSLLINSTSIYVLSENYDGFENTAQPQMTILAEGKIQNIFGIDIYWTDRLLQIVFDGESWDFLFHGDAEIKRISRKLEKLVYKIDKVELIVTYND